MLLPISTDAPIYHRPFATIGLIVVNVVVFAFTIGLLIDDEASPLAESLIMKFGTISPLQWVTNIFMHANIVHLLGNMIFLWTFGLIVEGKIGWWKLLLVYLLVGVGESAITQVLMLWGSGSTLGASAAVFGLMAVTMLWAPRNEITLILVLWIRAYFIFDVSVLGFCYFTIGWEVFMQVMGFIAFDGTFSSIMSGTFSHLLGACLGAGIGYWFLHSRRVDCEGYDLISVITGKEGEKVLTLEQEEALAKEKEALAQRRIEEKGKAYQFIQAYLDQSKPDMAIGRFNAYKSIDPRAKWKPEQLQRLIKLLLAESRWEDAFQYMEIFATTVEEIPSYRILQAEILIAKQSRPRAGMKLLRRLKVSDLTEKQKSVVEKLALQARAAIDNGEIEIGE